MEIEGNFPVEYDARRAADFVDVIYRLPENQGLLLSKNAVRVIDNGGYGEIKAVHYKGLGEALVVKQTDIVDEVVINEDLYAVTKRLIKREGYYPRKAPTYPILTVTNGETGDSSSREIDVLDLIDKDDLQIYTAPLERGGSEWRERIRVDLAELAWNMAAQVGIDADASVAVGKKGAMLFEAAIPRGVLYLADTDTIKKPDDSKESVASLDIEPRGEVVFGLLQMSVADGFESSIFRQDGSSSVELVAKPLPDMQLCMNDLIDWVEFRGDHLVCRKERIGDTQGFVFEVIRGNTKIKRKLAGDLSIGMAAYNAYETAVKRYPDFRF